MTTARTRHLDSQHDEASALTSNVPERTVSWRDLSIIACTAQMTWRCLLESSIYRRAFRGAIAQAPLYGYRSLVSVGGELERVRKTWCLVIRVMFEEAAAMSPIV